MDKSLHTQFDFSIVNPVLVRTADESIGWLRRPTGLRMIADDLEEEDPWTEDDPLEEDDDWVEDDDLEEDEDFDEDDDDFDDEEEEDFDDEEEDFDDDFDEDADDYEYEYRGDPGWEDADDDDEYNLLGTRFASLLDDPPAGPKRFRDREGMSKNDKRPKKGHRPRVTKRSQDEIENDDE